MVAGRGGEELELDATCIRSFESVVLPGLLQTEEYARAMFRAVRAEKVDDLVAARLTRQDIFERAERPCAWFIFDDQSD